MLCGITMPRGPFDYDDYDITEQVGENYKLIKENKHMNWITIKSALVSGVLMAILGIALNVIQTGDVFAVDVKELINVGVIALLTSIVSFLKSILTTQNGNFAGIVKVK